VSLRDLVGFTWHAVAGHRLRTGLSLLGVAIGVAAVVVLTALGEGARRYVTSQFQAIGSNILILMPGRTETTGGMPGFGGVPNDLTLDDILAIRRGVPEVSHIAPIAMGTETVAHGERRRQVAVAGTTPDMQVIRQLRMARGRYLPESELHRGDAVAVLGKTVAEELFPGADPVGQVIRVGDWRMRVIGVTGPRGVQIGLDLDDLVVVPVATGMRLFNRSSLFRVFIQVRSPAEVEPARAKVIALLTERHGEEDVTCITQDAVISGLSAILTALTVAVGAIAAISLAVAGIGIMNVMLVSVSERTREIGLLRALGTARRQVLAVFLAEAVLISTAGGLLGLGLGLLAERGLVAAYPNLPARAPLWAVSASLLLSVAVGAAFGVLPARRATRLDPVAALAGR
jgi:putative ABC transport system permease protein